MSTSEGFEVGGKRMKFKQSAQQNTGSDDREEKKKSTYFWISTGEEIETGAAFPR